MTVSNSLKMAHLKRADVKKGRNKSFASVADVPLELPRVEECTLDIDNSSADISNTDIFSTESILL
jgi:hypothetical protein